MIEALKLGMVGEKSIQVTELNTAAFYGSGLVDVFATPAMITLMEGAALNCTKDYLRAGTTTVGTMINVKHIAATPIGMQVVAKAEIIELDGRRLVFKTQAFDEKELIGEGIHERFIIKMDKFLTKAQAKL